MDKPKKGGLLLALMGKPKDEPEDDEESSAEMAAQGVLDAIESKDAKALADAMRTMVDACSVDDDYDDE